MTTVEDNQVVPLMVTVVVIDDHDLLRQGVISCLKVFDDLQVVGEASRGEEAIGLVDELAPDVVVMDLLMPGMSGVEAIGLIRERHPDVGILALTSFIESSLVRDAIDAGATSYLLKSVDAVQLADAIRMTARGGSALAPEVTRQLAQPKADSRLTDRLTERELEIAELIAKGRSNADIAHELSLSIFTVKNHVSHVLSKLHAKSRTEAASLILAARSTTPEADPR